MPPWRFGKRSIRLLVVVVVVLAILGGAVAVTFEVSHTIPGTTIPAAARVVNWACASALPASSIVNLSPTNAWAIFSRIAPGVAVHLNGPDGSFQFSMYP